MNDDQILLRHVHGELSAAEVAALERRLRREPDLVRRLAGLERAWEGLEPPPVAAVDREFRDRVVARARNLGPPDRLLSSGRSRLAAAAALVVGIGLGLDMGSRMPPASLEARIEIEATLDEVWGESGDLARGYWDPMGADESPGEEDDR